MRWLARSLTVTLIVLGGTHPGAAAELDDAEKLLATGKYEQAIAAARSVMAAGAAMEWRVLLIRALVATGQREQAAREAQALVDRAPNRPLAWLLSHETHRDTGDSARAAEALRRLRELASSPGASIEEPEDLVAAGRAALLAGDEPKAVLSAYFDEALKRDPTCKAAYLAGGQLGLDKHDDRLAAEWFQRGLAKLGADADLYAGLARAHYQGDRKQMTAALDAALHLNGRHRDALLLRAEHEIDGEDYPAATGSLEKVVAVDARQPHAWAFQAVLAHLRHDRAAEDKARAARAGHPPHATPRWTP